MKNLLHRKLMRNGFQPQEQEDLRSGPFGYVSIRSALDPSKIAKAEVIACHSCLRGSAVKARTSNILVYNKFEKRRMLWVKKEFWYFFLFALA